jgi:hypothetical protein
MRRRLGLCVLLAATAASADTALSPEAAALIAPVHEAYAQVEKEQAALPPAMSDRERLERLDDLDQAGRVAEMKIDFTPLPQDQKSLAETALWEEIGAHDLADQEALKTMIPPEGWFRRSEVGKKAAFAAFLIVQHATNDPELMRATLPKIETMVKLGEADGGQYALLYDRIAVMFENKPQRYGSQMHCVGGKWVPQPLEDPEHLDELRASVGLSTEAEYVRYFEHRSCG